jgi:hypothetical protein
MSPSCPVYASRAATSSGAERLTRELLSQLQLSCGRAAVCFNVTHGLAAMQGRESGADASAAFFIAFSSTPE